MATRSGFKNGKCRKYVWIRNMLMSGWLTLLFLAGTVRGQGPAEQDAATKAVLKVTNAHFTRGQSYPSNYLTVFSDRRAECDTVEWSGQEAHVVKSKILTPEEFEHLTSILSDPELLGIKSRYESRRIILDSWMEWDVGIQRAGDFQKIAIINFSPTPYLQRTDIEPILSLYCDWVALCGSYVMTYTETSRGPVMSSVKRLFTLKYLRPRSTLILMSKNCG